jgi:hypothetical protein
MCVMDEQAGDGYDAHVLTNYRKAKKQLKN